jgi:hypothetical protein
MNPMQREMSKLGTALGVPLLRAKASAVGIGIIPAQALTVADAMKLHAAGSFSTETQAAMKVAAMQRITAFQPPPFPKAYPVDHVAALMYGLPGWKPCQPVQRVKLDPNYKAGGGAPNFATAVPTIQYTSQDGEWISLLQAPRAEWSPEFRQRVRAALEEAVRTWCVTSGPLDGWWARIKLGANIKRPEFRLTPAESARVMALLPFSKDLVRDFRVLSLNQILSSVTINASASSGFPFLAKKGEVLPEMLERTAAYYNMLLDGRFREYAAANLGEFLTIVKNKKDRYLISDWGRKIRPYFCMNGAMALLYSVVWQNYSAGLLGFWQNNESCNAHGFSWVNGGGNRLYSWIAHAHAPGLYAIAYSDDAIVKIVLPGGRALLRVLDVAQMDMSIGSTFLPVIRAHLRAVLAGKMTSGWTFVADAATQAAFSQMCLLTGPLCYLVEAGLMSGIPGTPEIDQIAFATKLALLQARYDQLVAEGAPPGVVTFDKAEATVRERIGLKFKDVDDGGWLDFEPGQPSYPLTFLGKQLLRHGNDYIPHVPLKTCVVQLVTPKTNHKSEAGRRAFMERCRGLAVTSLYTHPQLFELAEQTFNSMVKEHVTPASTMDGEDSGLTDVEAILGTGVRFEWPVAGGFPTRAWVMALYTGRALATAEAPGVVPVQVKLESAAEIVERLFPRQREQKNWADYDPVNDAVREAMALPLVKGGPLGQPVGLLAHKPEDQFQKMPIPADVKAAFHAAWRAARARQESERNNYQGKTHEHDFVRRLAEHPEEIVVFTKDGIVREFAEAAERDLAQDAGWEEQWAEYEYDGVPDEDYDVAFEAELDRAWNRQRQRDHGAMARQ